MRIIRKLSAIVLTSVLTLSIVLSAWSMAETETEAAAWQYPEVLKVPPADLSPWSMLLASRKLASFEKKKEVQRIRKSAEDRLELALEEARASFESEKEQALADAAATAESEKAQALADAAATAESEKAQALADAAATAESERAQALADAAAIAETEMEQALADAAATAETELEQALAGAAATAESEKAQALADAAATAESEKAQALADAAATAESEKAQALADAAATAESEKAQALADAAATAESEKAQALADAKAQWDTDLAAQRESEEEALYNSHVWTSGQVQIREAADPASSILVIADDSSPVTVLAQEEDAFLIDYYGIRGYVDRSSLTIPEAMKEQVASAPGLQSWCSVTLENAATHLNVREGPGTQYPVIDRLDSEEVVCMTGERSEDGSWAQILYGNEGNSGWASTRYLTVRAEGEPEELTRLMYYAEYGKVAKILREEDITEPAAWQNGSKADPQTLVGQATILSDDRVYTGEVVAGKQMGYGTLLKITEEENCYIRITGTWSEDVLNGMTVWSFCDTQDPSRDLTISGNTQDSQWQGDIIFHAPGKDGKLKYFYGYADHGVFKVKASSSDGTSAVGRSTDGEFLYLDAENTQNLLKP